MFEKKISIFLLFYFLLFSFVRSQNTGPYITSAIISDDNTTMTVTFNEPVFTNSDGTGDLTVNDFSFHKYGGTGGISYQPRSINKNGNQYILGIKGHSGVPNGEGLVTVFPYRNVPYENSSTPVQIFDEDGNPASKFSNVTQSSTPDATGVGYVIASDATDTLNYTGRSIYNTNLMIPYNELAWGGTNLNRNSIKTGDLSYSFWINLEKSPTQNQRLLGDNNDMLDFIWQNDGSIHFMNFFNGYHNFDTAEASSPWTATLGKWHHIVFVRDMGSNKKIYIDGSLISSTTDDGGEVNLTPNIKLYGTNTRIDELSIFDFPLTDSNVNYIYNNGNPLDLRNADSNINDYLKGYWKMEYPNYIHVNDVSSFNNHGNSDNTINASNWRNMGAFSTSYDNSLVNPARPTIQSISISNDNSLLKIKTSEPIYNSVNGVGLIDEEDFNIILTNGNMTFGSPKIKSFECNSCNSSNPEYTFELNLEGISNGSQSIIIEPVSNSIFDNVGNEFSVEESYINSLTNYSYPNNSIYLNKLDNSGPQILELKASLISDYIYSIVIEFNENIYSLNSGSGILDSSDFNYLIQGGVENQVKSIESFNHNQNIVSFIIEFSNVSAGEETVYINPKVNSIFDQASNVASSSQKNNSFNLIDILFPSEFELVNPINNYTIDINKETFLDTLYFAWNRSDDPYDTITYNREMSSELNEIFINFGSNHDGNKIAPEKQMFKVPYNHIQEIMFKSNKTYASGSWNITASDDNGNKTLSSNGPFVLNINASTLSLKELLIPKEFQLHSNYPNPFNPITTISFDLPEENNVQLNIYDISGRKISTLHNQKMKKGYHQIKWNGTNQTGEKAAAGVYIYQLKTDSFTSFKKMILMK